MDEVSTVNELMGQLFGYRLSQAIHVAATLGIADLLADGPKSSDAVAREVGAHAPSMYRLLRALASEGIFEELPERGFALNAKGALLRTDAPNSVKAWAVFIGRLYYWHGWGNLEHSVMTGESGVRKVLGMDSWTFRGQNPEETAVFDRAMTSMTRTLSPRVVAAHDWGQYGVIADIAGGHGAQLADILVQHPGVHGMLFDQPHVVAGAPDVLRAAGVDDRVEVVSGSFFESVPAADAYILKHILHDWNDEDCGRILGVIHAAAPEHGRLLVIERLIEGENEGPGAKMSDLNMLVGPGGMERTRDEFEALLSAGGWRLAEAAGAATHHVLVCERA